MAPREEHRAKTLGELLNEHEGHTFRSKKASIRYAFTEVKDQCDNRKISVPESAVSIYVPSQPKAPKGGQRLERKTSMPAQYPPSPREAGGGDRKTMTGDGNPSNYKIQYQAQEPNKQSRPTMKTPRRTHI